MQALKRLVALTLVLVFWQGFSSGLSTWQIASSGTTHNLVSVFFVDSMEGWAVGEGDSGTGIALHTTNGGVSWSTGRTAPGTLESVFLNNSGSNNVWIGDSTGGVYYSTNEGTSWNASSVSPLRIVRSLYFFNSSLGFAAGDSGSGEGVIMKTIDGGQTWSTSEVDAFHTIYSVVISPTNPGIGLAGGGAGPLFTTDGGTTWNLPKSYVGGSIFGIAMPSSSIAYSTTYFKSTDGGKTWLSIPPPSPPSSSANGLSFVNTLEGWTAEGIQIRHTADGGNSWDIISPGQSFMLNSIYAVDQNHVWAVESNGGMVAYTDQTVSSTTTTTLPSNAQPSSVEVTAIASGDAINISWTPASDTSGIAYYWLYRADVSQEVIKISDDFSSSSSAAQWTTPIQKGGTYSFDRSGGVLNLTGAITNNKGGGAGYLSSITAESFFSSSKPHIYQIACDVDLTNCNVGHNNNDYILAGPILSNSSLESFIYPFIDRTSSEAGTGIVFATSDPILIGPNISPAADNISAIFAGPYISLYYKGNYIGKCSLTDEMKAGPYYYGFLATGGTTNEAFNINFDNYSGIEYPISFIQTVDAFSSFYRDSSVTPGQTYLYGITPFNIHQNSSGSNVAIVSASAASTTITTTTTTTSSTSTTMAGEIGSIFVSGSSKDNTITMQYTLKDAIAITVYIINGEGRTLASQSFSPGNNGAQAGANIVQIAASSLPAGVYYYEIKLGSGILKEGKFLYEK